LKRRDNIDATQGSVGRSPERKSFPLTNDVRAELVALTGHDITADDPIMVLVVLNQILLPRIAEQVAETMRGANVETAEALTQMRAETLKSVTGDLLMLAGHARDAIRVDLAEASGRAAAIVAGLEASIKVSRGFWAVIGAAGCGLLVLGIVIGFGIGN